MELENFCYIIENFYYNQNLCVSWFYFKSHPYCYNGSSNLFYSIQLKRDHLNVSKFKIAKGVVQNNAHMAHSEIFLMSALVGDDLSIRKLALLKVIEAKDFIHQHLMK